jgi:molecular chaperone DnaK
MSTIDYGIDLGTTNSVVAVLRGVDTEIIKNNDDRDTTPSAVWIDRRDRTYVGRVARERAELDPGNTCLEFKLRMGGADVVKRFEASGRELTAEQLSAEVLKSLRGDVRQRHSVDLTAAVITVPAAFNLSACEATSRAGALAGLTTTPLLQEPTAAAFAYGFQREQDARWLVYDMGGGTFDAAVVQVRDGEFTVLTHRGDNYLGGKLIDWQIVETLLLPELGRQFGLDDLRRGNPRWSAVIGKLKLAAEAAKIRLSRADTAEILLEVDTGAAKRVEFEYDLRRADVARLADPYIVRSLNLCRRALAEANLGPADISRVLLVGGPTLSPYLRERLSDPDEGLGILIDHSQDPLTVVARGAAIFAGTQRRPEPTGAVVPGQFTIALEYPPIGPDTEPLIIGRVLGTRNGDAVDLTGYTVEVVNPQAQPTWRSGRTALRTDGLFSLQVHAEQGQRNTYRIELYDDNGTGCAVTPGSFSYTIGIGETSPRLTNSVGVGLDGNTTEWMINRYTPLPAYGQVRLRTTVEVRGPSGGGMIRIPLLEGEHPRADRNRRIGTIEVVASQLARDVPEGSEIQVRIDVDESRRIVAKAYVPLLDEEFEQVVTLSTETAQSVKELADAVKGEHKRLERVRERQQQTVSPAAEMALFRIDSEQIEQDLVSLLDAAHADPDAATTCGRRLLDLRAAIDEVEDALEWPEQVREAEQIIAVTASLAARIGEPDDKRRVTEAKAGARAAIDGGDPRLLRMHTEELGQVAFAMLDRSGELDILIFEELRRRRADFENPVLGTTLITEGQRAIARDDRQALHNINVRLRGLLPVPPPPPDIISTVLRAR